MKRITALLLCLVFVFALTAFASADDAADFPNKEITIICPWKAGAGADTLCRMFEKLGQKYFGVPVVVVNKAGAGGQLAHVEYLEEKSDGYTILFSSSGLFTTQPFMGEVEYSIDDYTILTGITDDYNALACSGKLGVNNLEEFINYFKDSGKTLKYGHSGTGAIPHIVQAMLYYNAGINAQDIPFDSASETVPALLGGHVDAIAQGSTEISKLAGSEDAVILGVFSPERSPNEKLKDVPTMKEQGYDITLCVWRLMLCKADTPTEIVEVLREGLRNIINDPEFAEYCETAGIIIDPKDEATALATIEKEAAAAQPVFESLGMGIFGE